MYAGDNKQSFVFWAVGAPTQWWAQGILPYVNDTKIFECPSAENAGWRACGCGGNEMQRPVHYGANCGSGGQGGTQVPNWQGPIGQKDSAIQEPSQTVWVADSTCVNIGPWAAYPAQGTTCPGVAANRHGQGVNFGYCDGHVAWARAISNTSIGIPFGSWTRQGGD